MDAVKLFSFDGQRWILLMGSVDVRAHFSQRRHDPLHGPP